MSKETQEMSPVCDPGFVQGNFMDHIIERETLSRTWQFSEGEKAKTG